MPHRPHHHTIPNMVHKTMTAMNNYNESNGAVMGMVVAGMAVMVRLSYLRLYIFYLCNKWILFLYFMCD